MLVSDTVGWLQASPDAPEPALPCHPAEPGCHLRIFAPFPAVICPRHRPAAAGGAEPGEAAPPAPAAGPAGMLGPAGGAGWRAEVALGDLGWVYGDRGAALPPCGEEEVEAAPVRSREKRKGRGGRAVPAVRGQVCVCGGGAVSPCLARERGRSCSRGSSRPWILLEEAVLFPPCTFWSDACSSPGGNRSSPLSPPAPAARISVCWRFGSLFITLP